MIKGLTVENKEIAKESLSELVPRCREWIEKTVDCLSDQEMEQVRLFDHEINRDSSTELSRKIKDRSDRIKRSWSFWEKRDIDLGGQLDTILPKKCASLLAQLNFCILDNFCFRESKQLRLCLKHAGETPETNVIPSMCRVQWDQVDKCMVQHTQ